MAVFTILLAVLSVWLQQRESVDTLMAPEELEGMSRDLAERYKPSHFRSGRKPESIDWDYSSLAFPLIIATASSVVSTSLAMNRKFTRAAA